MVHPPGRNLIPWFQQARAGRDGWPSQKHKDMVQKRQLCTNTIKAGCCWSGTMGLKLQANSSLKQPLFLFRRQNCVNRSMTAPLDTWMQTFLPSPYKEHYSKHFATSSWIWIWMLILWTQWVCWKYRKCNRKHYKWLSTYKYWYRHWLDCVAAAKT